MSKISKIIKKDGSTAPWNANKITNAVLKATTAVENDEWEMVREYIWKNRHLFTGISLLTKTGDKEYPQAPREAVKTPADIAKWNSYTYEKVDYKKLIEEEDSTNLKEIIACAGGACEIS